MLAEHDILIKLLDEVRSPRISFSIGDATYLVECCLNAEAITLSRAAELLGLRLGEARERWAVRPREGADGTGEVAVNQEGRK